MVAVIAQAEDLEPEVHLREGAQAERARAGHQRPPRRRRASSASTGRCPACGAGRTRPREVEVGLGVVHLRLEAGPVRRSASTRRGSVSPHRRGTRALPGAPSQPDVHQLRRLERHAEQRLEVPGPRLALEEGALGRQHRGRRPPRMTDKAGAGGARDLDPHGVGPRNASSHPERPRRSGPLTETHRLPDHGAPRRALDHRGCGGPRRRAGGAEQGRDRGRPGERRRRGLLLALEGPLGLTVFASTRARRALPRRPRPERLLPQRQRLGRPAAPGEDVREVVEDPRVLASFSARAFRLSAASSRSMRTAPSPGCLVRRRLGVELHRLSTSAAPPRPARCGRRS